MNHKKIIIGAIIFLVIAVIALFVAKAVKDKKDKAAAEKAAAQPAAPAATKNTANPTAPAAANSNFPIVWNKYNPAVIPLQAALGVKADGVVGNNTVAALNKLSGVSYPASLMFYISDQATVDALINKAKQTTVATPPYVAPSWMSWNVGF
jgi:hypothetical protein